MASKDSGVSGNKEDGYNFSCPLDVFGRPLPEGSAAPPCGFVSSNWPTKADALARSEAHFAEHESGEPMAELIEVDTRRSSEQRQEAVKAQAESESE